MSLTSHLGNSQSPIRSFFSQRFPNTRPVTRECAATLSSAETIRPGSKIPYGTLGTAIDYRLRYYFSETPFEDLVAWTGATYISDGPLGKWEDTDQYSLAEPGPVMYQETEGGPIVVLRTWQGQTQQYTGRDLRNAASTTVGEYTLPADLINQFFTNLEKVLEKQHPAGRRLERPQEEKLARYCIVLALFEEVFRAGARPGSPLFLGEAKTSVPALLSMAESHWVEDLFSLSGLFYEQFAEVLSHPATLNPTFDGSRDVGGADADLILDGCLIDFKATINPKVTNLWLYQLLGYVFLDYSNQHRIHEVGIYLAR